MWSDYCFPEFDDPDSPNFAGDMYLPIFGEENRGRAGFMPDLYESALTDPIGDIRNQQYVVMRVLSNSELIQRTGRAMMEKLESDPTYDWFGETVETPASYYDLSDMDVVYHPSSDIRKFDRGKYKGQRVMDVYATDPSYIEWATDTILKYVK